MFDPNIGRWLSDDPILFQAGDANLRRYVGNNPTNARDPSGLQEIAAKHAELRISQEKALREAFKTLMTDKEAEKLWDLAYTRGGFKMRYMVDNNVKSASWSYSKQLIRVNVNVNNTQAKMIGSLLFEVINASNTPQFQQLDSEAEKGKVSRIDYAVLTEEIEYNTKRTHIRIVSDSKVLPPGANKFKGDEKDTFDEDIVWCIKSKHIDSYIAEWGDPKYSDAKQMWFRNNPEGNPDEPSPAVKKKLKPETIKLLQEHMKKFPIEK